MAQCQLRRSPRVQDIKKLYKDSSTSGEEQKEKKPRLKSPKKVTILLETNLQTESSLSVCPLDDCQALLSSQ